jgi:putative transposase
MVSPLPEVSLSHFYRWRSGWRSKSAERDAELSPVIKRLYEEHDGNYGYRRMTEELQGEGIEVGHHRVARLMRDNGLKGRIKPAFRRTTDSDHEMPVAPNLLDQNFEVDETDRVWAGDISYIRTTQGWLFIAVILDLCSRKVVGWAMSTRIDRQLCLDALQMALWRRRPGPGLLHHSDRGSQYTSDDYQKALEGKKITCSMSRRGNCWDNAVVESFFATLKRELFFGRPQQDRERTADLMFRYIETYYNRKRRHSSLGYLSPEQYEQQVLNNSAAKLVA